MKLQPAMIFGEYTVLQRQQPVPVWGRSAADDTITVTVGPHKASAVAENGIWCVMLPEMEATESTIMTITSALTGESLCFRHVAIGEVWLAGGQSNMEFRMKYDENAEAMRATPADPYLRYFRYPQAAFLGHLERDPFPRDGFWRVWEGNDNINEFSAAAAYMGRQLRKVLEVPVGFVGCNWGGTPAAAWTSMEEINANPALKPVKDWYEDICTKLDWRTYETDALIPAQEPTPEMRELEDRMMMGEDLTELFKSMPHPAMPTGYSPYMPGPKSAVRPAGLYENILKKIHPFAVRGVIWYQGEDDDARGWQNFYAESMKSLIQSWRDLWGRELPFLQVELAPFAQGVGMKQNYPMIRAQQRLAADMLPNVHNVCIMDSGDPANIHVRKKQPVGERLALLARKYVYGEPDLLADSPRLIRSERCGNEVKLYFSHTGDGLHTRNTALSALPALNVAADNHAVEPNVQLDGNALLLRHDAFASSAQIVVQFAEENYCEVTLCNSADLPVFPFTVRL